MIDYEPHNITALLTKSVFYFSFIIFIAIGSIYLPLHFLIISLCFALVIYLYKKPLAGFAVIIISIYLTNITFNIDSPSRTANEIVPFAIIPILITYIILLPKLALAIKYSDKYLLKMLLLILFLFGWAMVSFLWTHDSFHGIFVLITFLSSILVCQIFIFLVEDKENLFRLLAFFSFVGIFLGILLVASKWYSEAIIFEISHNINLVLSLITDRQRPGGFAPPDNASTIMNMLVFISIAQIYRGRLLKRIFLSIIVFFFIICSLLTASKGGAGSLFVGLFLLIFCTPLLRNWIVRLTIAFSFFLSITLIVGGNVLLERIRLVIDKGSERGFISERLEWWSIGFDKLGDTYGIGLGVGGFLKYLDPVPGVHNLYFSLLFDLGIVGFSIFMIIIIVLIGLIIKTVAECKDKEMIFAIYCFIASLVTFGLQCTLEGDFQQIFFWILFALILSVLKVARNHK